MILTFFILSVYPNSDKMYLKGAYYVYIDKLNLQILEQKLTCDTEK